MEVEPNCEFNCRPHCVGRYCKHSGWTFTHACPSHAQTLLSHKSYKPWRFTVINPACLLTYAMSYFPDVIWVTVDWWSQPVRELADQCWGWFPNDSKKNSFKKNCLTRYLQNILNEFFVMNQLFFNCSSISFPLSGIVGRLQCFPNHIPAVNSACTRPRWRNDAVFPRQIHFIPSQSSITPADESAYYSQVWLLFLRGQSIAKPCAE